MLNISVLSTIKHSSSSPPSSSPSPPSSSSSSASASSSSSSSCISYHQDKSENIGVVSPESGKSMLICVCY